MCFKPDSSFPNGFLLFKEDPFTLITSIPSTVIDALYNTLLQETLHGDMTHHGKLQMLCSCCCVICLFVLDTYFDNCCLSPSTLVTFTSQLPVSGPNADLLIQCPYKESCIQDTLSNESSAYCPRYIEMYTELPL